MKKNTVNAILENLSRLNEVKSINLGSGKTAYQSNGKYYIKSGDTKKEISAEQYQKLLSKDKESDSKSNNPDNSKSSDSYKSNKLIKSIYDDELMTYEDCLTLNDNGPNIDKDTHEEVSKTFGIASKELGCSKEDLITYTEDDGNISSITNNLKSLKTIKENDETLIIMEDSDGTKFCYRNSWGFEEVIFRNPNS